MANTKYTSRNSAEGPDSFHWFTPSSSCVTSVHVFTIALHSFLSLAHTLASTSVIPLSFRAFFTLSFHLYCSLPLTLFPLILLFITFFVNLTSSILSMCPNHLKTLLSALPDKDEWRSARRGANVQASWIECDCKR